MRALKAVLGAVIALSTCLGLTVWFTPLVLAQRAGENAAHADTVENAELLLLVGNELVLPEKAKEFLVLPKTDLTAVVHVPEENPVQSVSVSVKDKIFSLRPTAKSGEYTGTFTVPDMDSPLQLQVNAQQGQRTKTYRLQIVKLGGVFVYGNKLTSIPVENVTLTVSQLINGKEEQWTPIGGQQNPQVSADGSFGWYVENGAYVIQAERSGYELYRKEIAVTNNVLRDSVGLRPDQETTAELRGAFGKFTEREEIQTAADVASSASTALAFGSTAILVFGFNLLGYLQYLYSLPALLLSRDRRKAYGVVYNSLSKVPLELAIVRVYSVESGKLVKTIVTGKDGQYSLSLRQGQYRLVAHKPGFIFPSEYLRGTKDDGQYLDVYTTDQLFEVTDEAKLATPNIPLDPIEQTHDVQVRAVVRKRFIRTLQKISTPSGLVLSLVAFIIKPLWLTAILVALQFFVLLLVLRLVNGRKIQGQGRVLDADTGRPLRHAMVRVFETKYNKLIETVLSDGAGQYAVLLGPNEYAVSFSKPGYLETLVKPLDYTRNTSLTPFVAEISLQRE